MKKSLFEIIVVYKIVNIFLFIICTLFNFYLKIKRGHSESGSKRSRLVDK